MLCRQGTVTCTLLSCFLPDLCYALVRPFAITVLVAVWIHSHSRPRQQRLEKQTLTVRTLTETGLSFAGRQAYLNGKQAQKICTGSRGSTRLKVCSIQSSKTGPMQVRKVPAEVQEVSHRPASCFAHVPHVGSTCDWLHLIIFSPRTSVPCVLP